MNDKVKRPQGPQVKKLICSRLAQMAIPPGGGVADGVLFLSNKKKLQNAAREATEWVFEAIDAVRNAPGGEAYGDDEAIAKTINDQIDNRRRHFDRTQR